jgi:phosphoribosyl-ATP pyrophosphohydrolase/phosphoribosyl-AMP cyclohydrolase
MVLNLSRNEIEEFISKIDFEKGNGLVPVIIQDASNDKVLMQAYMNEETLRLTLTTGKTHFWSRTRNRIWQKGEESGHHSLVQNAIFDCDNDAILLKVQQIGPICHTGKESCFYNPIAKIEVKAADARIMEKVFEIIKERRDKDYEKSYVSRLLRAGEDAVIDKVKEESAELIHAVKEEPKPRMVSEAADLIFHALVLLASKKIELNEVFKELVNRHKVKTDTKKD